MAGTWTAKCSECGERHQFLFVDGDLPDGRVEYEYECPKTNETGRVLGGYVQVVQHRPAGAVTVRRAD